MSRSRGESGKGGVTDVVPTLRDAESGPAPAVPHFPALVEFRTEHPLRAPVRHLLERGHDGLVVDSVVIGRGPAEPARRWLLIDDPRMSRQHVALTPSGESWRIEDLGSLNGSLINGERLQRAILFPGDVVEVGRTLLVYSEAPPSSALGDGLATYSAAYAAQLVSLEAITATSLSVLLLGETGTGKEVLAREIHRLSGRSGPYTAVNCGALTESLVASELFGYRKGAFSGAGEDREGLVRASSGGTLFLDEVADLPPSGQAALLRVLQEREVLAVGGTRPVKVDLRVVAATHRDLDGLVAAGAFRADLHARLAGFTLRLPPLRRRREDLGLLIATLLARLGSAAARVRLSMKAARALFFAEWPRNVRELEQALTSAVALARGELIELEHLPESLRAPPRHAAPAPGATARKIAGDEQLRDILTTLLGEHRGNLAEVARAMNKAPTQIRRWLRRLGLDADSFRS